MDDDSIFITPTGKILTEEDFERMAEEAASEDYEPKDIRPIGRPLLGDAPSRIIQVRLDPAMADELAARAEKDHTTNSEVLRQALNQYLAS